MEYAKALRPKGTRLTQEIIKKLMRLSGGSESVVLEKPDRPG